MCLLGTNRLTNIPNLLEAPKPSKDFGPLSSSATGPVDHHLSKFLQLRELFQFLGQYLCRTTPSLFTKIGKFSTVEPNRTALELDFIAQNFSPHSVSAYIGVYLARNIRNMLTLPA